MDDAQDPADSMSDDFELVRGSGNVFRDFDMPNPDLEQLRAILAVQIIKALDRKRLTVRKAAELTGIAAADFSRIRNANIGRFTVDRLMTVLGRLDQRVDVNVKVRPNVKRAQSHLIDEGTLTAVIPFRKWRSEV